MARSITSTHLTDSEDQQLAEYRALAGQAVAATLLGLLAPLAMIDPILWAVPALGFWCGIWALRRIKKSAPALIGRKGALLGLVLSTIFLAAAPTDWLVYRKVVRDEARQFADLWFQYLLADQPQMAHQLTVAAQIRQPMNDSLWGVYRNNPKLRQQLEGYVGQPLVRTLLALGPKAQVRFYQTAGQAHGDADNDAVELLYAVSYDEGGERKSFFVGVDAARMKLATGGAGWRVTNASGGVRPEGW